MLFTCHGMFIFVQLHQQQQQELTTSRECTSIVQIVITCTSNAQILNYRFLRENHVLFLSNVCPSLSSYLLPIPFVEVAQQQRDEVVELSDLLLVIILQRILKEYDTYAIRTFATPYFVTSATPLFVTSATPIFRTIATRTYATPKIYF